jgi:hypothetical protein
LAVLQLYTSLTTSSVIVASISTSCCLLVPALRASYRHQSLLVSASASLSLPALCLMTCLCAQAASLNSIERVSRVRDLLAIPGGFDAFLL